MAQAEVKKIIAQDNSSSNLEGAVSLSPGSFPNVFSGLLVKGTRIFKDEKNQLNIKALNLLLFFLAGLLAVYYANGIIISMGKVENIDLEKLVNFKDSASVNQEESLLKPLSFYQEALQERDIFRMGQKSALDTPEVISSKAAEASQTLKMVGISWSDKPDAMIEDTKTGKTYFVKTGQMVGDFQVVAIYKDRVTLRYGVENIDLR